MCVLNLVDALDNSEKQESQRIYGVVIGIVTNNQDPDELGRVKVSFPWRGDDNESHWARIASPMAGNQRGMVFLPEVNDEVLVAFENGNIDYPYILGALWNGKDSPPETNSDGKNNIRKIKSRSGHELIFNDDNGKEKIEIISKGGSKISIDDSTGSEKIEIADGKGSGKIVIDAQSISIESTMQLKIKGKMVEIEADSMMTIKAGGIMTIKGSLVKIN
jgi:uncharacterized protein involved in type VI secretion and phage assembly